MSEVLKKRLKESIGKEVKVFLYNNFHYFGKITNCDDVFLEILDYKINSYTTLKLEDIKHAEISAGEKDG